MPVYLGNKKCKIYFGNTKIKKVYLGTKKIYSCGNTVTYCVDTEVTYQEEIDEGVSCLSPSSFSPAKSGWTFVGWRQDTTASNEVINSLVMAESPIILYAVFQQSITLSYDGNESTGGSTDAQTGTRYYNNGNVKNPSFSLRENGFSRSEYTFNKWAMGSAGGTQYDAGAAVTLSASTTFYAVWTAAIQYIIQNGQGSMVEVAKDPNMSYKFGYSSSDRICGWYNVDYSMEEDVVWATCRSPILDLRGIRRVVVTIFNSCGTTAGIVWLPSTRENNFSSGDAMDYMGSNNDERTHVFNAPFPSDYCFVGLFLDNGLDFSGAFGIRELRLEP